MTNPVSFIHDLQWSDLSQRVRTQAKLNLLDLIGVAVGGAAKKSSQIMRNMAASQFGGTIPMMFDGRNASSAGVALAAGMTIDALDGHDGYNPAKGHIGCPLFASLLPVAIENKESGKNFLSSFVMGYEFGARASVAQHGTVPDYHTSGSWGAVTGAAAIAKMNRFDIETTRHALGIAEYHGPRSQMMRCIDHPTMLKDGSSWGAMTAVTAAALADAGFTGAPAITVESAPEYWGDLGERWMILEQYYKPYPVCRWAQAPIEAALGLCREHKLTSEMIAKVTITTFHESIRLATSKPRNTDEAQYSTSFPVSVALVKGDVGPADIADNALDDPEILRLSAATETIEDNYANSLFPLRRIAKITLTLCDGRSVTSGWEDPKWDPANPPSEAELRNKYHVWSAPLGDRAKRIEDAVDNLDQTPFSALSDLLSQPISS